MDPILKSSLGYFTGCLVILILVVYVYRTHFHKNIVSALFPDPNINYISLDEHLDDNGKIHFRSLLIPDGSKIYDINYVTLPDNNKVRIDVKSLPHGTNLKYDRDIILPNKTTIPFDSEGTAIPLFRVKAVNIAKAVLWVDKNKANVKLPPNISIISGAFGDIIALNINQYHNRAHPVPWIHPKHAVPPNIELIQNEDDVIQLLKYFEQVYPIA